MQNAANTNVVPWHAGLLATFESGQPHALDAHTLKTLGPSTLNGALRPGVPLQTPSAHLDAALGAPALAADHDYLW